MTNKQTEQKCEGCGNSYFISETLDVLCPNCIIIEWRINKLNKINEILDKIITAVSCNESSGESWNIEGVELTINLKSL